MFSRFAPIVRPASGLIRRKAVVQQSVRCMSGDDPNLRQTAIENRMTLDDLPKLTIPWKEYNAQRQKSFNLNLIASIIALGVTYYIAQVMYPYALYMNDEPKDLKSIVINWDEPDIPPVEKDE